jgi:predicted nucleic acid-binding Zn ribbon protein
VRRRGPRPIASALEGIAKDASPPTVLARVQASWSDVVGAAVAAEAQPVGERDGTVTIACRSAAWASELDLLGPELIAKLNDTLKGPDGGPVSRLRTKVAKLP